MEKPTCVVVLYPNSSAFIHLLEEAFGEKSIQREEHRLVCFGIDNIKRFYKNSKEPPCFSISKEGKSLEMCFANEEKNTENDRIISSTQLKPQQQFGHRTIGDWTLIGNNSYNQYNIEDLAFGFTLYNFDF